MNQQATTVDTGRSAQSRFFKRREDILNAAGVVINRYGLRDATLSVVAGEIGLNLKSLRYYFARKEDLVVAAFERSIALHREVVATAVADADTPETRIRRFVADYFAMRARIARGEQAAFAHFGDLRALAAPNAETVFRDYGLLFRQIRALFGEARDRARLNADTHMLLSQLLWSVIWLSAYVPEDYPRVAERFTDILLGGIVRRPLVLPPPTRPAAFPGSSPDRLGPESFLRAATALINEQGYRGASVDRISALLGVTKGAFYHHNDNRDALVVACFERSFDLIRAAQDQAMAMPCDGAAKVAAATVALVTRQMVPEGTMLRTSALTAIGLDLRVEMQRRMSGLTCRFADMLNDGLIDESVRPCDMRIASEMITATINSAEELQRWVRGANADNAADLYVRPLLNGLLAR